MIKYYFQTYKYPLLLLLILWIISVLALGYLTHGLNSITDIDYIQSLHGSGISYQLDNAVNLNQISEQQMYDIYTWVFKAIHYSTYSSTAMIVLTSIFALVITSKPRWDNGVKLIGSKMMVVGILLITILPFSSYTFATLLSNLSLGLDTPYLLPSGQLVVIVSLLLVLSTRLVLNHSYMKYKPKNKWIIGITTVYCCSLLIVIILLAANYQLFTLILLITILTSLCIYLYKISTIKLGI